MATVTRRLFDRERELAALKSALDQLSEAGRGAAIWVQGPPGIGKTALLQAAEELGEEGGVAVLRAAGAETEAGFPFELVRQLFAPLVVSLDERLDRALAEPPGALAASILRLGGASAAPEPVYAALFGLTAALAQLARERPLLVALDDLQWADADSLRFVVYLARRCRHLPVLLLIASHEPEVWRERGAPYADDLGRVSSLVRPAPIGEEAVKELAKDSFGEDPPAGFAAALRARTGGNPLFVRELIEDLRRAGLRPGAAALRRLEEACPEGAARLVARRLAPLSAAARALCEAAASLPGSPRVELAAEVAGITGARARELLPELDQTALLRAEAGHLRFAHPLVRTVLLRSLAEARRAEIHAAAARVLREDGASDAEIAARLVHAAPGCDPQGLATLRRAGVEALERGAAERAATLFERALAEAHDEARCELLLLLGRAELAAGKARSVERLRRAARSKEPATALAAARALARTLAMSGGRDPAAILRETLGRLDVVDAQLELAARAELAAIARAYVSSAGEGRQLLADLSRRRPGSGSPAGRAALAAISCDRALAADPSEEVATLAERALDCGPAELIAELSLGYLAASALIFADRLEAAGFALRRIREAASRAGAEMTDTLAAGLGSVVALRRGDVSAARAQAEEVRARAREGGWGALQWVPVEVVAAALLEAGELDRAETVLTERLAEADPDEGWAPAAARFELGRLALARRDHGRAARELAACGAHLEAWRAPSPGAIQWRPYLAFAEAQRGRLAAANELLEEDLGRCRAAGLERSRGVALRAAAMIRAHPADAEPAGMRTLELLEEAAEIFASARAELELARTEWALGTALAARGDLSAARARLRSAAVRGHRCGSLRLLGAASARLAALGGRLPSEWAGGLAALSPRELRVARLAAAGRSNREIADELVVTVKTVEYHLTNAYKKLGIRRRGELPAAVGEPTADADEGDGGSTGETRRQVWNRALRTA